MIAPYALGNAAVGGVKLVVYRATPLVKRNSSMKPLNAAAVATYPTESVPVAEKSFAQFEPEETTDWETPLTNREITLPELLVTAT